MKSKKYWAKRAEAHAVRYDALADDAIRTVQKAYDDAAREIQREINSIVSVYAKRGGISDDLAREMLSNAQSQEIILKLNILLHNMNKKMRARILAMLDLPAYGARISRLQALQVDITHKILGIAPIEISRSTDAYKKIIEDTYYHKIYDLQQHSGVVVSFAKMDAQKMTQILNAPWSGDLYSNRVWKNTTGLAEKTKEILARGALTGRSVHSMARELSETMGGGKYAAERLMRTESAYMANRADLDAYQAYGVQRVQFLAALDSRTCSVCGSMDGKIILVKDLISGLNLPPLHPRCRCTTVEAFDDDAYRRYERIARDPATGKTYYVDGNVEYEEWIKKAA